MIGVMRVASFKGWILLIRDLLDAYACPGRNVLEMLRTPSLPVVQSIIAVADTSGQVSARPHTGFRAFSACNQ
jgi:hypothetical protein